MEELYYIYEEGVCITENPVSREEAYYHKGRCDYFSINCEIVEVKE